MNRLTSSDGTTIAFERSGDGPPVILVCGGSTDRTANAPLSELLAEYFTVFNYDRRGRGDSGDTAPYAVEREIEDIDAVIARQRTRRGSTQSWSRRVVEAMRSSTSWPRW